MSTDSELLNALRDNYVDVYVYKQHIISLIKH